MPNKLQGGWEAGVLLGSSRRLTLLGGGTPGGGAPGGKISTSDKEANDEFLTFNWFSLERKTCFTHLLLQGHCSLCGSWFTGKFILFLMESTISTSLPLWLGVKQWLQNKFVKSLSLNGSPLALRTWLSKKLVFLHLFAVPVLTCFVLGVSGYWKRQSWSW